jgi:16S rRNA (guanine966-N2)-methyltransferase
VRVIGGSARGRPLKGPPRPRGSGRTATRPTSDLIRGVIFDMLDALGASYDRVLDLYCGTGALGIEALSRGEGTADFVDDDATALATVRANLAALGFTSRAGVHRAKAAAAASRLSGPYTLVLADPPYYDEDVFGPVAAIAGALDAERSPLADEDTVIVVEHRRGLEPPETLGALPLYKTRRHGDTVVSIYAAT